MDLCILETLLGDGPLDPKTPLLKSPSRSKMTITFVDVDSSISQFAEDDLVSDALKKGIDLREYDKNITKDLKNIQDQHINDYVARLPQFASLELQVKECDAMLGHMVDLLEGFHVDLNKISAEIRDLQDRSNDMNLRLKNRVNSQDMLSKVLDGLVITPDLIKKICEGEVNEFFLQHLLDLNKKMTFVKSQKGAHVRALKDVGPELERLRLKSSEKIREFLLKRIESEAAGEVRAVYITTVQQYYLASFEKYIKSLSTVQTVIADKGDLIGSAEAQGSGGSGVGTAASRFTLGLFSAKNQLKDRANVYSLGERVQVLTTEDAGIILPHIAEEQRLKFPYEVIFKSVNRLLMDNASSEYIFTTEFFSSPWRKHKNSTPIGANVPSPSSSGSQLPPPPAATSGMDPNLVFAEIMEPTLKFIQSALRQYIDNSYDAVGVLLCIRLNTFHLRMMQKRRIPCLENFMNLLNILLWPRFQAIMVLHIESLWKVGKIVLNKDCHPHFITRRYAEFAASVLALNDGFDDALLLNSLVRLRNEVESLLYRMSDQLPDRTDQLILWINNHDLVHSILGEYNLPCIDDEKNYFAQSLETKTGEYVEEELKKRAGFGFLMEFVDRAELEKNLDTLDTGRFESVASQFNSVWKQGITDLNASILQSFPNFQNGARILHAGFTLLLLFYRRFLNLFEKRFVGKASSALFSSFVPHIKEFDKIMILPGLNFMIVFSLSYAFTNAIPIDPAVQPQPTSPQITKTPAFRIPLAQLVTPTFQIFDRPAIPKSISRDGSNTVVSTAKPIGGRGIRGITSDENQVVKRASRSIPILKVVHNGGGEGDLRVEMDGLMKGDQKRMIGKI
ncbi:UNVERIFIED_CONTAM: hypothetical protein HDU68_006497 [Siphonaria sp. JEL0065]|nr:hypothetical protein HDU68_006497 [Siphonaria sp. JEL0065]